MSSKIFFRFYIILAILSWLSICAIEYFQYYLYVQTPDLLTRSLLSIFYIVVFLVFKMQVGSKKIGNFNEYLWQVFAVGGSTILISLLIKFLIYLIPFHKMEDSILWENIIYHINTALMVVFLANGFYVWKKLILYHKNKFTYSAWGVFEVLVLLSSFTNFFNSDIYSVKFFIATLPITLLGIFLSFNLKWVAFLNYKQKWQSIAFIVLILIINLTFLQQVFVYRLDTTILVNMANNTFTIANFTFLLLNCTITLLVLLFHLPTSSVFEKKFGEVMSFQKLSQSISMGDSKEEVYNVLIDSCIDTVMADAGWLEINNEQGKYEAFLNRDIDEIDVFEIKKVLRKNNINISSEPHYIKDVKAIPFADRIQTLSYRSILIIPLSSNNQKLGTLILLKNLLDGFDKEMVDITYSFVSQASLAIKNFKLVNDAIENERYHEERKIAKEVQKSLLPESLMLNINIELHAFSKAADEVGGDYYDIFKFSEHKTIIVIGDVSGNGTSAAFNMAQMKGIFHSLVQLELSPEEFMILANNALSKCLEKTSFITLSIFYIDTLNHSVDFARAGHCPALLFQHQEQNCKYLHSKGLGLGIIRNKDYAKHIQKSNFVYQSGDLMLIFTDGIIEAHNPTGEEYGYDRLKIVLQNHHQATTKQIADEIIADLYQFTGTNLLADDYSFLIIRFI
ncbi:MAG: sigma factor sigB regulation protein [Cytophagales bacterium]|nr:MAG: sigma factor sigB regulation protein [Cytophagales bacterium]